jgi:hypothetical protein
VGPGRPPPRAGRGRRLATWLASVSGILLFVAPISWVALSGPRRTYTATVAYPFVAPLDVQSPDSAIALGRLAGAQTVVVGATRLVGDSLTVVATAYDVATGALVGQTQRTTAASADQRALLDTLARSLPSQPRENQP